MQIRTLEERLVIAHSNVEVQRESLNIAEIRFHGGTTSERDVEQARTVLASTEATIPQIEASLQQTKNALCVLLGIPPSPLDEILSGSSGIPTAPMQVAAGIPADLLRRRPDVRSAELRAAAQSAQIGVAKADLYPAFSLTGNFGFLSSDWSRFDLSDIFMAKSRAYSVGPSVQWNFLNYGQITNNVRVQDAAFQALVADYGNTVLSAQREVEDGLVAFAKAQQRTELLRLSSRPRRARRSWRCCSTARGSPISPPSSPPSRTCCSRRTRWRSAAATFRLAWFAPTRAGRRLGSPTRRSGRIAGDP